MKTLSLYTSVSLFVKEGFAIPHRLIEGIAEDNKHKYFKVYKCPTPTYVKELFSSFQSTNNVLSAENDRELNVCNLSS